MMHFSPCSLQMKVPSAPRCTFFLVSSAPLPHLSHLHPPPPPALALSVASEGGRRAAAQSPAAHPQSSALSLLLPEANRSSQTRSHPLASLLSLSHFLLLALHPPPPPSPISHLFLHPSPSSTLPFKSQEPLFSSPFPSSSLAPCVLSIFFFF